MSRNGLNLAIDVLADAGSEQHGPDEAGPSADGVHDRGTSEVDEFDAANTVEPATVPFPAASNWVDEGGEDQGENYEFAELDPLSHKTRNDRGGGSGEGRLEQEINGGNQAGIADGLSGDGWIEEEACEIQPTVDDGIAVHELSLIHISEPTRPY